VEGCGRGTRRTRARVSTQRGRERGRARIRGSSHTRRASEKQQSASSWEGKSREERKESTRTLSRGPNTPTTNKRDRRHMNGNMNTWGRDGNRRTACRLASLSVPPRLSRLCFLFLIQLTVCCFIEAFLRRPHPTPRLLTLFLPRVSLMEPIHARTLTRGDAARSLPRTVHTVSCPARPAASCASRELAKLCKQTIV